MPALDSAMNGKCCLGEATENLKLFIELDYPIS